MKKIWESSKLKLSNLKEKLSIANLKAKLSERNVKAKLISVAVIGVMAVLGVMSFSDIFFKDDNLTPLNIVYEPPKNINSKEGTNNNPFTFVEVVPDMSMSKMKYLFSDSNIKSANRVSDEILKPTAKKTVIRNEEVETYTSLFSLDESTKSDWESVGTSTDYSVSNGELIYNNIAGNSNIWWDVQMKMKATKLSLEKGKKYKIYFKYKMEGKTSNIFDYTVEANTAVSEDGRKRKFNTENANANQAYDDDGPTRRLTYDSTDRDANGYKTEDIEFTAEDTDSARIVFGFGKTDKSGGNVKFYLKEFEVERIDKTTVPVESLVDDDDVNTDPTKKLEKLKASLSKVNELEQKKILSKDGDTPYTYVDNNTYEDKKGYFQHVEEKKGDYVLFVNNGHFDFVYIGKDKGDYKWTDSEDKPANYTDPSYNDFKDNTTDNSPKIYRDSQPICTEAKEELEDRFTIKSNEWFKKKVLGLNTAKKIRNYNIQFYTVTPDQLNENFEPYENNNKGLIDTANFVYCSDYALDKKYDNDNDNGKGFANKSVANLAGKVGIRLIKNVVTNKASLVLDYKKDGFNEASKKDCIRRNVDGTEIEMYKLVVYTAVFGPSKFYNYFMNDFSGTYNKAVYDKDGKSVCIMNAGGNDTDYGPVSTFSETHFMPGNVKGLSIDETRDGVTYPHFMTKVQLQNTLGVVNGDLEVGNKKNHYDYTKSVLENVYFNLEDDNNRDMTSIKFVKDFYTQYSDKNKAFKPVLDKDSTSDLSSASIYKYLINYKNDNQTVEKDEINVLDVEPCKDFTQVKATLKNENYTEAFDSNDWGFNASYRKGITKLRAYNTYTEMFYRNLIKNFYGKVNIVKKTSSEFAGDISDYITSYDAMYFGDNVGMFNTENGVTVYNDPVMDGRLYTHIGDRMIGGMRMSGLLSKDQRRLDDKNNIVDDVYQPRIVEGGALNFLARTSYTLWANGVWTDDNDATKRFDPRTDGLDYDRYVIASSRIMNTEAYRFSGNDISQKVYSKLKEYADGGYPIIVADAFKNCDPVKLDRTSTIYKFFNAVKNKENVVASSQTSNKEAVLKKAANKSKVNIILYSKPTEYDRKTSTDKITYNTNNKADNILSFKFKITENTTDNGTYKAYLLIDSNCDGCFTKDESIKRMKNLKKDVTYQLEKAIIGESEFLGGISWRLLVEKDNADSSNNVHYNRAEKSGYTCIKRKSGVKSKIKVLQIMPDLAGENAKLPKSAGVFMVDAPSIEAARCNLEKEYYSGGTTFNNLTKGLDDFEFVIESTTVSTYVEYFLNHPESRRLLNAPNSSEKKALTDNNDGTSFKPNEYDVVILGFGDRYTDFYTAYNNNFVGKSASTIQLAKQAAVINLINYIDSKKIFIYSHDVMSFINMDFSNYSETGKINSQEYWPFEERGSSGNDRKYRRDAYWGYSINTYLRTRLGVDRFGITKDKKIDNTYSAASDINYDKAWIPKYFDNPSLVNQSYYNNYRYFYEYMEEQGFSNGILSYNLHDRRITNDFKNWFDKFDLNGKSMETIQRNGQTLRYYGSLKGTTDEPKILHYDANADTTANKTVSGNDSEGLGFVQRINKYSLYKNNSRFYKDDVRYTGKISKANDGMIANYPYKIGDIADEVALHCPYYQFNLDNSNATVWYCLADDGNSDSAIYADSPNDVRNYYHLYSVNNVYYWGAGQNQSIATNENEMKVLVNILVSAGKNKVSSDGIDIENSDGQGEDKSLGTVDVMYVYVDKHDTNKKLLNAKDKLKIDFTVYDPTSASGTSKVSVLKNVGTDSAPNWQDDTGATIRDGNDVVSKSGNSWTVHKDNTYSLYVDAKTFLANKDYCYYKLVAETTDSTNNKRKCENVIKVVRRNLIDMNNDD